MQPRHIDQARSLAQRVVRHAESLASRYPDSEWLRRQHERAGELEALLVAAEPFPDPNLMREFAWKLDAERQQHDGVTMEDFAELLRLCVELHLCPHCHYDLRMSPHRCPECGYPHDKGALSAKQEHRQIVYLGIGVCLMGGGALVTAFSQWLFAKPTDRVFWSLVLVVSGVAMTIASFRMRR